MDTIVSISSSSDEFMIVTGQNYTEVSESLSISLFDFFWSVPATSKSIGTFRETFVGVKFEGSTTVHGKVCIIEKCKQHQSIVYACVCVLAC